jgi:oligoribonuclease NrnB/cAMP/cGMP phosphodiesterase (DHH superfamily)
MLKNEKPNIPAFLLWEYDLKTFNYDKSYKIVIERVLQLGTINDWKEMIGFYPKEKILETIEWSAQLDKRDKDFSVFFLKSDMLYAV